MKLIAIDLDGTLLNSDSVISPENRAALQRADEAGILVAICTGRATFDVKALLKDLIFRSLRQTAGQSMTKDTASSAAS